MPFLWRSTGIRLRYRTAWRELLHPLPVGARQSQWLKRDTVEMNEALLRQPYYTLKSYAQPAFVAHDKAQMLLPHQDVHGSSSTSSGGASASPSVRTSQDPNFSMEEILKTRHVTSAARLRALREELHFPQVVGPPLPPSSRCHSTTDDSSGSGRPSSVSYAEEYGARLRPRYPESWDTVPPHQPSRHEIH